jgi:predicted nucleic acid-binding protein
MVELVLLLKGDRRTVSEIVADLRSDVGEHLGHVTDADVSRALTRLTTDAGVAGEGHGLATRRWSLTERGRRAIEDLERNAQQLLDRVVDGLFSEAPGGRDLYLGPFLAALRRVFSHLAEMYVLLIKGDIEPQEFATENAVADAVKQVAGDAGLDEVTFGRAMQAFLLERNPDYDAIKWNLTQNYYLLRVLGLDASAFLLTKDIFDGAHLYLDTNVLVNAFTPAAAFHAEFQALARACSELGIKLHVCQITLDELRGVVSYNRWLVTQIEKQVPTDTVAKVHDMFFQAFVEAKARGEEDPISAAFDPFDGAADRLAEQYGVERTDDVWFVNEKDSPALSQLAEALQQEYAALHDGREKRDSATQHDALLVRWVERQREFESPQTWILTLDTSLTRFRTDKQIRVAGPKALALTLGALLQWVSPIAAKAGLESELTEIFR